MQRERKRERERERQRACARERESFQHIGLHDSRCVFVFRVALRAAHSPTSGLQCDLKAMIPKACNITGVRP